MSPDKHQNPLPLFFFSAPHQFEVLGWNQFSGIQPTLPKHSETGDRYSLTRFYICHLLNLSSTYSTVVLKRECFWSTLSTLHISQCARHWLKESFLQFLRYPRFGSKEQYFSLRGLEFTVRGMYGSEKQNWNCHSHTSLLTAPQS